MDPDLTLDRLAGLIRDWIHEQPFSICAATNMDTCPDWPMAHELAKVVRPALTVERDALKADHDRVSEELADSERYREKALAERDEAIRERDAEHSRMVDAENRADELDRSLDESRQDVDTLLEAIAAYKARKELAHGGPGDLRPLYATFHEIAKKTGWSGGQGDG